MVEKHISSQFDAELGAITTRVFEMGGVVESQLQQVLYALDHSSFETCDQVLKIEDRVNQLEVQIDHDVTSTMCRRQPTARDLRLLVGVSRIIINLERAGDECSSIARIFKGLLEAGMPHLPVSELRTTGREAAKLLHDALDAFARMDVAAAVAVLNGRKPIEEEHSGMLRKLLTYMMEDPRTIGAGLKLQLLSRCIERVAAHAENIAEAMIYVARGADIRHTTEEQREAVLK